MLGLQDEKKGCARHMCLMAPNLIHVETNGYEILDYSSVRRPQALILVKGLKTDISWQ